MNLEKDFIDLGFGCYAHKLFPVYYLSDRYRRLTKIEYSWQYGRRSPVGVATWIIQELEEIHPENISCEYFNLILLKYSML